MAYVEPGVAIEARQAGQDGGPNRLAVDIRGNAEPADVVPLPFYRRTTKA
jgi:hypothetical protein